MSRNRFTRRAPKRNWGQSWGRYPIVDQQEVIYRIFRRDHTGRLHFEERTFFVDTDPKQIASALRQAKRQLRDRVDEIDLEAMEVAA